MSLEMLKELKSELIELKKETENSIDLLANKFAILHTKAEFNMTDKSEEEIAGITAKLLAHGTILSKTKTAIEEEIAEVEEAIAVLE